MTSQLEIYYAIRKESCAVLFKTDKTTLILLEFTDHVRSQLYGYTCVYVYNSVVFFTKNLCY